MSKSNDWSSTEKEREIWCFLLEGVVEEVGGENEGVRGCGLGDPERAESGGGVFIPKVEREMWKGPDGEDTGVFLNVSSSGEKDLCRFGEVGGVSTGVRGLGDRLLTLLRSLDLELLGRILPPPLTGGVRGPLSNTNGVWGVSSASTGVRGPTIALWKKSNIIR